MAVSLLPGQYFGAEQNFRQETSVRINITNYGSNESIAEHDHANPYLSLLINGGYQEISNNLEASVKPGEALFRPASYIHANQFNKSGGKCMNVEWQTDSFLGSVLSPLLAVKPHIFKAGSQDYLNKLIASYYYGLEIEISEEYLLLSLSEQHHLNVPTRLPWMALLTKVLDNEYHVHHSLATLADRLNLHPVYLARAFKKSKAMTIGEYQLKIKTQKATALLFEGSQNINRIAYSCGFTDASHLIKAFRLHYRVTPAKFRRALKF